MVTCASSGGGHISKNSTVPHIGELLEDKSNQTTCIPQRTTMNFARAQNGCGSFAYMMSQFGKYVVHTPGKFVGNTTTTVGHTNLECSSYQRRK